MKNYLCDGDAAVEFDEVVEIAKQDRDGHEADVARIAQQMRD